MPAPHNLRPLNLSSVANRDRSGDYKTPPLPQITASLPTTYPSPRSASKVAESSNSIRSVVAEEELSRLYRTPNYEDDIFSPPHWAKEAVSFHEDEVAVTIEEFQKSVACNLTLGKKFGPSVASDLAIEDFLAGSDLYDSRTRRWKRVPQHCTHVEQLFRPMRAIVDEIIEHFGYALSRPVMDSFHISSDKIEFPENSQNCGLHDATIPLRKIPHMMALGLEGRNFGPLPSPFESGPSYVACISPVDFQIDDKLDYTRNLVQLAIYARQCFRQQHNRRFVYALMISESKVQIFIFDRSGACHSRRRNIHLLAVDFVRMLLGVWSPDDDAVGFDTTIHWDKNIWGHWRRYINSVDENNGQYRFMLTSPTPISSSRQIEGRGTTCWITIDAAGNPLMIKDAWYDDTSAREWEFLEGVSGLEGVEQIVNVENDGVRVSQMRGIPPTSLPHRREVYYTDRQFTRLMVLYYGTSTLEMFRSRKDLLFGLRDAIAGHQILWDAGILHGNICADNIVLTSRSSPPGERSVLINLELAAWVREGRRLPAQTSYLKGTNCAYQSINVLESYNNVRPGFSRDHLDDLESFYYTLAHICSSFTMPGERIPYQHDFFEGWDQEDRHAAAVAKLGGFLYADYQVTAYFGAPFESLLGKLHTFFAKAAGRKRVEARRREHTGAPAPTWSELRGSAARDYEQVLEMIDEAIWELDPQRFLPWVIPPHLEARYQPGRLPAGFTSLLVLETRPLKRSREDDDHEEDVYGPDGRLRQRRRIEPGPPARLNMLFN